MAMVTRRRRFGVAGSPSGWRAGLGNVPIAGLDSAWSLGDPASDMWGASFYDGSKVMGKVSNPNSPSGFSWETQATLYAAPWDQATEDKITAAANANFASPEHTAYEYDKAAAASPEPMHSVLIDPEWRAIALQGGTVHWDSLSAELQDKIKAVPLLYAQLTGDQATFDKLAAAQPAPTAPSGPARYLQGGLETYADGTPVPGGYNALTDLYRQLGTTPGTYTPQAAALIAQNPALLGTLTPAQQSAYKSGEAATTAAASTNTAPTTDVPSVPMGGGGNAGSTVAAVVAQTLAAANPEHAGLPMAPTGPAMDVFGTQPAQASIVPTSLFSNPWLLAGVAVLGIVALKRGRNR